MSGGGLVQRPEAITSPFTFIATASSLKWEGVQPVFVDIKPNGVLTPTRLKTRLHAARDSTYTFLEMHVK